MSSGRAGIATRFPAITARIQTDFVHTAVHPVKAVSEDYDADAVLHAWKTGDSTALSDKNRKILDAAAHVIEETIDDAMSDYDKELAIHDWIIDWAHYDTEVNNRAADARPNPENDNPYGLLIDREAVCYGYCSTFQLFMDMLDIECLTVQGATYRKTNAHAWNMVRLGADWYCVDITWNDPTLEEGAAWNHHMFFNVTSSYLKRYKHFWDEEAVPEATGRKFRSRKS